MDYNDLLTPQAAEAVTSYFNYINDTGYVKKSAVYEILSLLFIEELLCDDDLNFYITDADINDLRQMLTLIYGKSCFINWPENLTMWPELGNTIEKQSGRRPVRGTSKHIRFSQNGKLRVVDEDTVHYWGLDTVYNGSNTVSDTSDDEEETDSTDTTTEDEE